MKSATIIRPASYGNPYGAMDIGDDQLPLLLDVPAVMRALNVSRTYVFQIMGTGELPSVKLGRVRRVRRADLVAFVEGLSSGPESRGLPSPRHEGSPG